MFSKLYRYLSSASPLTFLVAYVALIPLFAIGYCLLRGQHFYAPYARMEKPAIADAIRISGYIRDAIAKSYRGHESNGDGWQIAMSDIEVSNLATDRSNGLDFTVSFFATKHEGGEIVQSTGGPQFEAHLSQQKIVVQQRPGWLVCHIVSFPSEPDQGGPTEFNRHLLFRPLAASLQADAICLGGQEENALMNLLSGWSGDPRSLSGFPWRMLYFSATTITTVGFGDIVPLSGEARLLTAIEAIAGWLVAGLFLNALAARLAQRGANSM